MKSLLWPMLAQIGLTCTLYGWLTVARAAAVKRGQVDFSAFVLARDEPPDVARIARNLGNQFELPVIFYAVVVLLIGLGRVATVDVVAAWVFVGGRIIHTVVQTLTNDVPLRGRVFMVNFLALLVLVGHVALLAIEGVER
ncbi:MAG TPA: MAPEG family protein [Xanthobacteraceae bacterium]|nr:MAPEG family protein [Xanthobacteraceae bacterium]